MFLSFIIPIYNCETYIKECLGIIFQSKLSVDDFEVILVDDGSTDTSAEICRAYTEKYPNIQYFAQRNQGPATARNLGLGQVKGDYVWFVDSELMLDLVVAPLLAFVFLVVCLFIIRITSKSKWLDLFLFGGQYYKK